MSTVNVGFLLRDSIFGTTGFNFHMYSIETLDLWAETVMNSVLWLNSVYIICECVIKERMCLWMDFAEFEKSVTFCDTPNDVLI